MGGSVMPRAPRSRPPERQFSAFRASELYCPKCRRATPVRERLLLVLPDGDLYEYCCSACGEQLGKKQAGPSRLIG
jgi:hypothetical protein